MCEHDEDEQDSERCSWDGEEIDGHHVVHVVGQERGLRYGDGELEEFTVNAGCAPQWIGETHLPDEITDVLRYGGVLRDHPTTVSGLSMMSAFLHPGHSLAKQTQKTRSEGRRRGRRGPACCRTASCWRRARISS
jgi:hypothetical protein